MLQPEIEPFADAHIAAVETIRNEIAQILGPIHPSQDIVVDREMLKAWDEKLRQSANGFYRFKVCMLDEVKTKEQYRIKLREHRLAAKD